MLDDQPNAPLDEVLRETTMGGVGIEVERPLPVIDSVSYTHLTLPTTSRV